MAKRVRHRSNWTFTEDGKQLVTLPVDTGSMTYTESHHSRFNIVTNTSYAAGIGALVQGNHLWIKASTGILLVCLKAEEITATNSTSFLTAGQMMLTKATFSTVKFKNKNTGSTGSTITVEYWVAGD